MNLSLAVFVSVILAFPHGSQACPTPYDYVKKVYSTDGATIEYDLALDFEHKAMKAVFFGKRGVILRTNTIVELQQPSGTFKIPERALVPPAQKWFNFIITDNKGCDRWGLVNEVPIYHKGNKIGIDDPSGEGHAFIIR